MFQVKQSTYLFIFMLLIIFFYILITYFYDRLDFIQPSLIKHKLGKYISGLVRQNLKTNIKITNYLYVRYDVFEFACELDTRESRNKPINRNLFYIFIRTFLITFCVKTDKHKSVNGHLFIRRFSITSYSILSCVRHSRK